MARTAQINFRRITLSLPQKTVKLLRGNIEKNRMSGYVANLIQNDLENKNSAGIDLFFDELKQFAKNVKRKNRKSSIQILRSIRYGKES